LKEKWDSEKLNCYKSEFGECVN